MYGEMMLQRLSTQLFRELTLIEGVVHKGQALREQWGAKLGEKLYNTFLDKGSALYQKIGNQIGEETSNATLPDPVFLPSELAPMMPTADPPDAQNPIDYLAYAAAGIALMYVVSMVARLPETEAIQERCATWRKTGQVSDLLSTAALIPEACTQIAADDSKALLGYLNQALESAGLQTPSSKSAPKPR